MVFPTADLTMSYQTFTEYPLWKEAAALADSVFDFSRGIEDFPIRNQMTAAAVEIPFLIGEAAQSHSDEERKSLLWKVEDPVNELRSVLKDAKEQGFAPGSDYELMQERCRNLFQKVHLEASDTTDSPATAPSRFEDDLPEIDDSVSI